MAAACPFPTELECACLFGMLASGFSATNVSTYPAVMDDNTVQRYYLTGEWKGTQAISEYMSFWGGDFSGGLQGISENALDFSVSTVDGCVMLQSGAYRVYSKAEYSVDGVPQCIDFTGGNRWNYTLTGNASNPILVTGWDVWTSEELMPNLFGAIDSEATADFMCNVITDVCGASATTTTSEELMISFDELEDLQALAAGFQGEEMTCLEEFANLPATDNGSWLDGDSRYCRILHGAYASINTKHCPHVSFEKEIDVDGKYKCYQSKQTKAEDHFSPQALFFLQLGTLPYNTSNPFFAAFADGNCPTDF